MKNPPAFPNDVKTISERAGMTLRDYFAAQALQGMLAMPNGDGEKDDYARWAYQYADAMLERRGDA